jgi:hydrogenase-1 operon protein HyaE
MTHALIQRLHDVHGYDDVSLSNHEAFIQRDGVTVLFFPGDPDRYRETADVAVILPELVAAFRGCLHPGVVAREAETELQMHYGFRKWPALVFLRNGGYLGAICKVRDWHDYLTEVTDILEKEPSRPPGFRIPVVSEAESPETVEAQ